MIDGVVVKTLRIFPDVVDPKERIQAPGFLTEILRSDDTPLVQFGQSTFTVTHSGAIKGFHWHKLQDEVWFVAAGRAKIVLHDRRDGSPTAGQTQVVTAGVDDYKTVYIPRGVAHGYQVVSHEPMLLVYYTSEPYNAGNPDEQRIPLDDPAIGFNWDE